MSRHVIVLGWGKSPVGESRTMSSSETSKDAAPSLTGKTWSGWSRRLSRNSGSTVAGSLPTMPARQARSVPWPGPVALRLPKRCTFSPVARASVSGGSRVQR
jgi:hypothetical protein